jgi:hypothetical protein
MNPSNENSVFPAFKIPSSGLHRYLFAYACKCAEEGISPEAAKAHISACVDAISYHRYVPDREICDAVRDAYQCADNESLSLRRLPAYNAAIAKLAAAQFDLKIEDLKSDSPQEPPFKPFEALQELFLPDELVCAGVELHEPGVLQLGQLGPLRAALDRYQFVVPNPMLAKEGITKSGHSSKRCADNTAPRRRIVCDFDKPQASIQPSLIAYLATFSGCDPELVLHSGGKSLHAWWRCDGWSDENIQTFEDEAVTIGADPALMGDGRRCQFVRLPAGRRNNGKPQTIHYWNPSPIIK